MMATYMSEKTNPKVYSILEHARVTNQRVRIWYGDIVSGRDWMESNDVIGNVGRSTGIKPIFLLIKNSRSIGGAAILTDCIVKITIDKKIVYQHEKYNMPTLKILTSSHSDYAADVCWVDGKVHARFKTWEQAGRFISFLEGTRNNK